MLVGRRRAVRPSRQPLSPLVHHALEKPEQIPMSDALKAYPALVKPFIFAPGTKEFLWLHRFEGSN